MSMDVTLADTDIRKIISSGAIKSFDESIDNDLLKEFVGPSSTDLPIGNHAHEIKEQFRPHNKKIEKELRTKSLREFGLEGKITLEKEKHYAIPLIKIDSNYRLKEKFIEFSPKSSIGRVDMEVKTIRDSKNQEYGASVYDKTPTSFSGNVWNIVSPKSFNILIDYDHLLKNENPKDQKVALNQSRVILDNFSYNGPLDSEMFLRDMDNQLIKRKPYGNKFQLSLSTKDFNLIGYEAKNVDDCVNISGNGLNKASDFFKPIEKCSSFKFEKDKFYIMSTKERITVPSGYSIRVVSKSEDFEDLVVDYAGFLDPGFGVPFGNTVVLEVRALGRDIVIKDSQAICWVEIYKNVNIPQKDYSLLKTSNYKHQLGPQLAKYFINDFTNKI